MLLIALDKRAIDVGNNSFGFIWFNLGDIVINEVLRMLKLCAFSFLCIFFK